MIGWLLRFAIPALAVYLVIRFIKKSLNGESDSNGTLKNQEDIIEICPSCGKQKKSRHRCS